MSSYHDQAAFVTVPVIASFDGEGRIAPLYVGINGHRLKISSFWLKPSISSESVFSCKVADGGYEKILDLTFHKGDSYWSIPKAMAGV